MPKPVKKSRRNPAEDVPFDLDGATPEAVSPAAKPAKEKPKLVTGDDFPQAIENTIESLGIEDWDLLLVGDGSGNTWDHECGWAAVAVQKTSLEPTFFHGAMSHGSNNMGEMLAYLQPLLWYQAIDRQRRKKYRTAPTRRHVHIVTDSQYCQQRGSGDSRKFKRNLPVWTVFDLIERQGFKLTWHWIPRESNILNVLTDHLSRESRLLLKGANLPTEVAKRKDLVSLFSDDVTLET